MFKSAKILFIVLLAVFLTVGSAVAGPIIDFGVQAPTSGSISYAGGSAPLIGTGIEADNVVGLFTPSNSLVTLGLSNASLDFTTGSSTGSWTWGGGATSSINLVGGIPTLSIPDGSSLLSGSFGAANVTYQNNMYYISGASFTDVKNDALLKYYGLPTGVAYDGNFNLGFYAAYTMDGAAFTSSVVTSGDIVNKPASVPDGSIMLLLGPALLALGVFGRRRRCQS